MNELDKYKIALSLLPKIGPKTVRKLISYIGGPKEIFSENKKALSKIPGSDLLLSQASGFNTILGEAEKEMEFMQKNNVRFSFYLDEGFPARLRECEDAPVNIFSKGDANLNSSKVVSIVGTRKATSYGKEVCKDLVRALAELDKELIIVSGLAYGIDICAHKAAVENDLATIAVLGHGLHMVYPADHRKYIPDILKEGMLMSEFVSSKKTDPGNFVSRNRIIAGLADATVVVESAKRGGALLTADMANSYNRDVFAYPGRCNDHYSHGCNKLIRSNSAVLIESGEDLINSMMWDQPKKPKVNQLELFTNLSVDEENVMNTLRDESPQSIDEMCRKLEMTQGMLSSILLSLEFSGKVQTLPGKYYQIKA